MEQCGAKCPEAEEIKDIVTCAICLEIFENPRILPCSHTYCHMCLYALCEGSSVTEHTRCPQCRKLSIPPLAMLDQLPGHLLADQLADLIREREGIVETNESGASGEELYVGDMLPQLEDDSEKSTRSRSGRVMMAMLKGAAAVATLGLGGIYFSVKAARKRRRLEELRSQHPYESFTCANCQSRQYYSVNELRYICGMCEGFSLCHDCMSSSTARMHRPDHILIKLKFRQKRRLPPGCVLKYRKSREMSEEIDFTTTVHSRAYYHTVDSIQWTDGISCSFCAQTPIVGTRYKCGMCKDYDLCESCEEHSHEIHDRDHVFLIFKNRAKVNVISEPLVKALLY